MVGVLLGPVVVGRVTGCAARALVPGREAMGVVAATVLGIVGSFRGFLGDVVLRPSRKERSREPSGLFGAVVGATLALLVASNASVGRRTVHR